MAKSGLKHIDVGPELTKTEWESEDSHELLHGTSFPSSPVERQLFYRDDEHKWYIYDGTDWVWLGGGGGGMAVHGNEYHDPDFEQQGVAAYLVGAHQTTDVHTQPQVPQEHGNEKHNPDFEAEGVAASLVETHRTTAEHTQPQPSNFLKLSDTPSSYSGQASKVVKVKSDETGLEFAVGGGNGDLFALTRFLRASRYHIFPLGTNTTLALAANQLYAVPFFTPVARTVTRVAVHVTTLLAGNARLGIYQDDGSVYPGSLVADAGVVDTGSTGIKEITGLNVNLAANTLYWLVLVANAAPTISALTTGTVWQLLGYTTTALNNSGGGFWTVAFTYAALPATFPGGASVSIGATPKIAVYF